MGTGSGTYRSQFGALGTTAVVAVTDPNRLSAAIGVVAAELAAVDRAYSRFRPDSELMRLCGRGGRTMPVTTLLAAALATALHAASPREAWSTRPSARPSRRWDTTATSRR